MANCEDIRQQLLHGEWDQTRLSEARRLIEHLDACEHCRAALDDYDRLRDSLRIQEPVAAWPAGGAGFGVEPVPRTPATPRRTAWWIGTAASLLLAICGWGLFVWAGLSGPDGERVASSQSGRNGSAQVDGDPASLRLSSTEIDHHVRVFRNVAETFEGRTSWVAIGERDSEMGLAASPLSDRGKLLLLRLAVVRDERVLSNSKLAIVPGQSADLTVPVGKGRRVHYKLTTGSKEPYPLSLWAEIGSPGGDGRALAALATHMTPNPDQVIGAGRMVTTAGEYEVRIAFAEAKLPKEFGREATPSDGASERTVQ